ncbi:hypothetical protein [Skermanella stibiiresistens]|uniref:hypothetical protein n=1 Tax=Skermanella stibiiresistens TaxID=913326 RepID=UPI0012FB8C1A|nr:hypothetical protein [Skermanella stibiiresistens]
MAYGDINKLVGNNELGIDSRLLATSAAVIVVRRGSLDISLIESAENFRRSDFSASDTLGGYEISPVFRPRFIGCGFVKVGLNGGASFGVAGVSRCDRA